MKIKSVLEWVLVNNIEVHQVLKHCVVLSTERSDKNYWEGLP